MRNKISFTLLFCCLIHIAVLQTQPIKQFISLPDMQGASFSLLAKDINTGEILYSYDPSRELTPASVMKLVTTATALEILGENFRFTTTIEYDGKIENGILDGNLYIKGSGDPTLGSAHFSADRTNYTPDQNTFIPHWINEIKKAGIMKIKGSVVADESIFDTEGVGMKWLNEDMGNYYGAGSYGISVFDNIYKLYISTGNAGSKPKIIETMPEIPSLRFHNYLVAGSVKSDSSFIFGAPYADDRYLYGRVPSGRDRFIMRGDIPDPALFLAQYLTGRLEKEGIGVEGKPTCHRLLYEDNKWAVRERTILATTSSPSLKEIIRITNERSHNLYADALLKTLGLQYKPNPNEVISSFGKGIRIVEEYWRSLGVDTSSLWMYDGSGLAITDKVSVSFICDLLVFMRNKSGHSKAFIASLPKAGIEGSVINFLRGSPLHGKALLKSGGMSRVRTYSGYISKGNKQYAVAIFVNNYSGENRTMIRNIEKLLLSLF